MRRLGIPAAAAALVLILNACGGAPGGGQDTTTTTAGPGVTTASSVPTTTGVSQPPDGAPILEGGSAVLTLAGETVTFEFFVCAFGEAAPEFLGTTQELSFGAFGRGMDSRGGEARVLVSGIDSGFGTNYTVLHTRTGSDGSLVQWQRVGTDAALIEGDSVTAEGDFRRIIDNQPSDERDPGTLEATCSQNSIRG